eukprot:TRINITY_DN40951_c0_g1_i1.p1 TRINITY_DN40951_c0_g1~~TRINITY_DN40951_c0_g1_i1.p1  ORF type:complete len:762 (-),score=87.61 TRINITY_DN40951_c0_g1_i1:434-2719(-)
MFRFNRLSIIFVSILAVSASKAAASIASPSIPNSVSCDLSNYEDLLKQAHSQELKQNFEKERLALKKEIEEQKKQLAKDGEKLKDEMLKRRERLRILPGNWQLVDHSVQGSCYTGTSRDDRGVATFNMTLQFRVFEDQWTDIPLIDAQTIVTDWAVSHSVRSRKIDSHPVTLGRDALMVLRPREAVKDGEPWDDHVLVTNTSGLYTVEFTAFVHIRNDAKNQHLNGLQLNLLHPVSQVQLQIPRDQSANIGELSVEPFAHLQTVDAANYTNVTMLLPSTKVVSLKWRMKRGKKKESAKEAADVQQSGESEDESQTPSQATVMHDALHSIDENIISTLHSFKYSLDSEQSLNSVKIQLSGNARVTSVVAHGMKSWQVTPWGQKANQTSSSSENASESVNLVQVEFKSSMISKEVIVMITTETSMEAGAESKIITIPNAICQDVLRQSGTFAVVKVANLEIYEHSVSGATQSGTDSVPSHMRSRTSQPIVMAYKFLLPHFDVKLSLVRHEEISTLEAVVETSLYKLLVVESQIMHSLLMRLQNTRRQYMEVTGIPKNATLWTLKVNSVDTKPVRGRDGSLLVPLLVGTGNDGGVSASKTSVELVWLTDMSPLEPLNGTLALDPPRVDLPVSTLMVQLNFPESYQANFSGSLREVEKFSQSQPTPISYETGEDVVERGFDFGSMPPPRSKVKSSGVQAKLPKTGKRYLFEELLVVHGQAKLEVRYATHSSPDVTVATETILDLDTLKMVSALILASVVFLRITL